VTAGEYWNQREIGTWLDSETWDKSIERKKIPQHLTPQLHSLGKKSLPFVGVSVKDGVPSKFPSVLMLAVLANGNFPILAAQSDK
jgi:hypothetical protein